VVEYLDLDVTTQILGYIAVVLLFISFQIDNRKSILGLLIAAMFFLAAHQFLLGALVGAAANGLTIVRNIIFRYKNEKPFLQHFIWPYIFSLVLLSTCVLLWQGWYSVLPALAVIASTFALWVDDTKTIRLLSLIGPLLWLPYAFIIDSLPTILIQVVIITSILIAMFRFDRKKSSET